MGVTNYAWGPLLQSEADKCWFYAITFSILLSLYRLFHLVFATVTVEDTQGGESTVAKDEKPNKPRQVTDKGNAYQAVSTQLAIDCCDLMIPGSSTGWIPVELVVVGAAQFTSSALAGQQIWRRVQLGA